MPTARTILPFIRLSYGSNSRYTWVDDEGRQRTVTQAEGGEQGDPLMPLLFSIGIQGALEEVAISLVTGEHLCAYLDDVYLLSTPERVVPLYKLLNEVCWPGRLVSGYTRGKPRCGTRQEERQRTSMSWDRKFGGHRA